MTENLDTFTVGVSLFVKAVLPAVRFSGRVRRGSLTRLAAKDTDAKAREILFFKDRIYQLQMQLSILQRQWSIKPRFGVVGKHGSVAVTERVIKTLEHEWLKHVPLVRWLLDRHKRYDSSASSVIGPLCGQDSSVR